MQLGVCRRLKLGDIEYGSFELSAGELICLAIPQDWQLTEAEACLLNAIQPNSSDFIVGNPKQIDFSNLVQGKPDDSVFELLKEAGLPINRSISTFDYSEMRLVEVGLALQVVRILVYNTIGSDVSGSTAIDSFVAAKTVARRSCAIKLVYPLVGDSGVEFAVPAGFQLVKICSDERYESGVPKGGRIDDMLDLI